MRQIHLRLATACLVTVAAVTGTAQEEPNGSAAGSLRWTPHRAAARHLRLKRFLLRLLQPICKRTPLLCLGV